MGEGNAAGPKRSGDTVAILRTGDALRARQIADLLEANGIPVMTPGLEHRALLGTFGTVVDIVLRVPVEDDAEARRLAKAFDAAEPLVEGDGDEDDDDEEADDDEPARIESPNASYRSVAKRPPEEVQAARPIEPRQRRLAILTSIFIPGGGHLYVRRYGEGLALLALQVTALFGTGLHVPLAWLAIPVVWGADAAGASFWCAVSKGEREASGRGRWAALAGIGLAFTTLFVCAGPLMRARVGEDAVGYCAFASRCDDESEARCVILMGQSQNATFLHQIGGGCGRCLAAASCDEAFECADLCGELADE